MGGQQSGASQQKAERRAARQRRHEERRRRWEGAAGTPEPPPSGGASSDGSPTDDQPVDDTPAEESSSATTEAADPAVVGAGQRGARPRSAERTRGPREETRNDTAVLTGVVPDGGESDEPETSDLQRSRVTDSSPTGSQRTAEPDAQPSAGPAPSEPVGGPAVLWHLLLAAHPRQAVVTAAAFAGLAALTARPIGEVGVLGAMVLVGQAMLGWHNDLVDRDRDRAVLASARARGETPGARRKPVAEGSLEPGTVWYAFALALLLLVPLSFANGVEAGAAYVVAVAIGLLGNLFLRGGWFSWLPWAASYALFPVVLAYAEPPGLLPGADPVTPQPALVALAAVLGVVVHVLRGLPGLVEDHRDGQRHLPLRLGLKLGAPRVLGLASLLAAVVGIAILTVGAQLGLVR